MNERPITAERVLKRARIADALRSKLLSAGLDLSPVWLVGGAVRDAIIGFPAQMDVDIAVEGDGVSYAHLIAASTGGSVIATHQFGTASVTVDIGERTGLVKVDVASTRSETYSEPGALPDVKIGVPIREDLARRDISINAVAVSLANEVDGTGVVDPHDGISDMAARSVRVLHEGSFRDDPTRIFRAARYAGRLGFHVAESTRELAINATATGALGTVSADRVRHEFEYVLQEPAWESLTLLAGWGVLERLEPRLEQAFRPPLLLPLIDQACGNEWSRHVRAWPLRLSVLARTLGGDAGGWLHWLGFSGEVVGPVLDHVRVLDAVLENAELLRGAKPSEMYPLLGEVSDDSMALAMLAASDDAQLSQNLAVYVLALRGAQLSIRGDDVMQAGLPAGRAVGEVLGQLFLEKLDGQLPDAQDEAQRMSEIVQQRLADETKESES